MMLTPRDAPVESTLSVAGLIIGESTMSKAASAALKVGQKAPDFTVLNDQGQKVKLSDFRGKKVVLYFYPKDDTPGCTKEACAFRDGIDEIKSRGAGCVGVRGD